MLSATPLFRLTVRRGSVVSGSRVWTSPSTVPRRWSSAAASPVLVSPRLPLKYIFQVRNASAAPSSPSTSSSSSPAVVLRTGYHAAPSDVITAAPPASYDVTDVAAFEQLIAAALRVTPTPSTHLPASRASTTTAKPRDDTTTTATRETLLANHTVRELQALLAEAEAALTKPAARKAEIDRYVSNVYLPLLKYGTFAFLALQFGVYFNWIFFVFDWNLVEPTTYFIGYTSIFCSLVYHYYRCGEDDFSWRNLFEHMSHREAEKMYRTKKVDVAMVAHLERRVAEIKAELARVTV